ncbi:MAG: diphosphomevalonate decarboxylase [Candidatus Aenigmarchaeota archaeon]|nr:diphosphomevalonate decarboxylase [Candidatus Aenigmarchaeota archaeon]
MKSTAIANANIALTKYWGKREDKLILPHQSSVSVTLHGLTATTTVEFDKKYSQDVFLLNGQEQSGEELERVVDILNILRQRAGSALHTKVMSTNNFPTVAGFASSAAGAAALALAASKAIGLSLDEIELSILARQNSGSGTRSVSGGFVQWLRGEKNDGSDSYGIQLANEKHWPEFRILACITTRQAKKIKSRAGMKQSVANCPYYSAWKESANKDSDEMKKLILKKDFTALGQLAEHNCLKMHAVMMATTPSIIYWNEKTVQLMHAIIEWREQGLECYFTMDGGPQVKIICLAKDVAEIIKRVKEQGIDEVLECRPGEGVRSTDNHLF